MLAWTPTDRQLSSSKLRLLDVLQRVSLPADRGLLWQPWPAPKPATVMVPLHRVVPPRRGSACVCALKCETAFASIAQQTQYLVTRGARKQACLQRGHLAGLQGRYRRRVPDVCKLAERLAPKCLWFTSAAPTGQNRTAPGAELASHISRVSNLNGVS